jgi:demethylmenaquinone methyltransferase/2-methoxy-6-polyprenyl-1,4-benzoquinol methylase
MFNEISGRYDLINTVLSLGLHNLWKRKIARFIPKSDYKVRALDLATGTGDIATILARNERVSHVTGLDMSAGMLEVGREKMKDDPWGHKVEMKVGNAEQISFKDASFDYVTMAFGIRNVPSPLKCLQECYRVLKPGGRVAVLEFSLPKNPLIKQLNFVYLRGVVPFVGRLLSGHPFAYRYLNETIETFPYGQNFCALMEDAGFKKARQKPLSFGIATIYWADKT